MACQAFSGFYSTHMMHASSKIHIDGLPNFWVLALVKPLAKEHGSAAIDTHRPIMLRHAN